VFSGRTIARKRIVDGTPEQRGSLVIIGLGRRGRTRHGILEDLFPCCHERRRSQHVCILIERLHGGQVCLLDSAALLRLFRAQEQGQLNGSFLIGGILRNREVPATKGRRRLGAFAFTGR